MLLPSKKQMQQENDFSGEVAQRFKKMFEHWDVHILGLVLNACAMYMQMYRHLQKKEGSFYMYIIQLIYIIDLMIHPKTNFWHGLSSSFYNYLDFLTSHCNTNFFHRPSFSCFLLFQSTFRSFHDSFQGCSCSDQIRSFWRWCKVGTTSREVVIVGNCLTSLVLSNDLAFFKLLTHPLQLYFQRFHRVAVVLLCFPFLTRTGISVTGIIASKLTLFLEFVISCFLQ